MGSLQVLVLYVTVEQEDAIRAVYEKHNWKLENKVELYHNTVKHGTDSVEHFKETQCVTNRLEKEPESREVCNELGDGNKTDSGSEEGSDRAPSYRSVNKTVTRSGDGSDGRSRYRSVDKKKTQRNKSVHAMQSKFSRGSQKKLTQKYQTITHLKTQSKESINADSILGNKVEISDVEQPDSSQEISSKRGQKILRVKTQKDKQTHVGQKRKASKHLKKAVKEYKCDQCSYSTNINSNFRRHSRTAHVSIRHSCSFCPKTFKANHEAKSHELHAHLKTVKCEQCDKTFKSRSGLLNHNKQVHLKKALYECEVCQATFYYKHHYEGHMNNHNEIKPFLCPKCGKEFTYKTAAVVHERGCNYVKNSKTQAEDLVSGKKSKVLCDLCGEALCNKTSLSTHYKFVHSDAPKSECTLCGKQFKGKYSLLRHHKLKHTEEKNASFPCEVCGKTFNQVTILRQHLKRHKQEYSVYCGTCGKGFYFKYKMKEHERMHTGEKPFTCSVCDTFRCTSKTNLMKHMALHKTGKKVRGQKKSPAVQVTESNQSDLPLTSSVMSILEPVPLDPVYKTSTTYTHEALPNGELITHDASNNPNNMVAMTMTNEMIRYNHGQFGEETVIDGAYDPTIHADSYYGNMNMSTSSNQMSQGLNILTVAMNIVNPDSY